MRGKHRSVLISIRNKANVVLSNMLKPSSNFLTDHSKVVLLLWILFIICASCHTVLSVPCSLVVTCWEKADILGLLCVMFSCVFVTFPYGVLGQVWYLIVWIPDLLPYIFKNYSA